MSYPLPRPLPPFPLPVMFAEVGLKLKRYEEVCVKVEKSGRVED
jgi:hypothetical protein